MHILIHIWLWVCFNVENNALNSLSWSKMYPQDNNVCTPSPALLSSLGAHLLSPHHLPVGGEGKQGPEWLIKADNYFHF